MNPHSFSYDSLLTLLVVGLLVWFSLDMRSILKSLQRKNQLKIDGRWKELERYYERESKPRRPFVWLHRRYFLPGNITTQHALFLHTQGRLEEALAKADLAIQQIAAKPTIFKNIHRQATFTTLCGAFRARCLTLTGLGRYHEARQVAAQWQQLTGSDGPNPSLALLEYYCGHLDEALAHAQATPREDAKYDAMRGVTSLAYTMKGQFDEALQALDYVPSDGKKFYSPEGLKSLSETPEGAKLIELHQKKNAAFFPPARLINLARVYIAREEFEIAVGMLDEAEKSMGPQPGLQSAYCRHRACSSAALGNADEAEKYLERLRAMVQKMPKRSLLRETQFAAGRSYMYLGRFSEAIAELTNAWQSALHPIEKHATAYWLARTHESAGQKREAISYYQIVAADPIPSWMRKHAVEALAGQKS